MTTRTRLPHPREYCDECSLCGLPGNDPCENKRACAMRQRVIADATGRKPLAGVSQAELDHCAQVAGSYSEEPPPTNPKYMDAFDLLSAQINYGQLKWLLMAQRAQAFAAGEAKARSECNAKMRRLKLTIMKLSEDPDLFVDADEC